MGALGNTFNRGGCYADQLVGGCQVEIKSGSSRFGGGTGPLPCLELCAIGRDC
jgi:hypothetical protein